MILGQVGEDSGVEVQPGHPVLVQGVGGNLHDDHVHVRLLHVEEQFVEHPAVRGGQRGVHHEAGPAVGDGAEDAHLETGSRQQVFDDVGGGRLAVGAGDADQLDVALFHLEKCAGQFTQGGGGVLDVHGDGLVRDNRVHQIAVGLVSNDVGRALVQGAGDVVDAAHGGSGHGHETFAFLDLARVRADHESLFRFLEQGLKIHYA